MFKLSRCSFLWRPSFANCKRSLTEEVNKFAATINPDEEVGSAVHIQSFRCKKKSLADHGLEDEGLFYHIPTSIFDRISPTVVNPKGFSKKMRRLFAAFNEACMMIRRPGLELVNYLKSASPESTINRYLLYGSTGSGKTMTLQYAVQYCMSQNWLVVPGYHCWDWIKYQHPYREDRKQELIVSQHNKERVDQPELCTKWLEIFRIMNQPLLDKIFTTKTYVWSKHESSEKGITLGSLVDHGIARPRNATDVIGCIMREVRVQDHTTRPPTLVAVDCVNALFWTTELRVQHGISLKPNELSFIYNLKKLMANTWKHGAVITAVSAYLIPFLLRKVEALKDIDDKHPYDLIGREGFDLLDPHVPIHVSLYNDKEIMNYLAYYIDRKWLVGRALTRGGQDEIIQLSCYNPRDFVEICGGLD